MSSVRVHRPPKQRKVVYSTPSQRKRRLAGTKISYNFRQNWATILIRSPETAAVSSPLCTHVFNSDRRYLRNRLAGNNTAFNWLGRMLLFHLVKEQSHYVTHRCSSPSPAISFLLRQAKLLRVCAKVSHHEIVNWISWIEFHDFISRFYDKDFFCASPSCIFAKWVPFISQKCQSCICIRSTWVTADWFFVYLVHTWRMADADCNW